MHVILLLSPRSGDTACLAFLSHPSAPSSHRMSTPARHAFAPLTQFIEASSISQTVQTRATVLFNSAKVKTQRGSGNELPSSLSGNMTAVAAGAAHLTAGLFSSKHSLTSIRPFRLKPASCLPRLSKRRLRFGILAQAS